MATYQLRAMLVGEILDGSLTVLRRHFGLFLGLAVACLGLPTVINLSTTYSGEANLGLQLFSMLLWFLGYLLLTGASVHVVSEAYLGRTPEFGESLRFAVGKMGGLFISGFAVGIVTSLAFLALVIPAIIVFCGLAVTVPVVVLEPLPSATDALRRSWSLTNGQKGRVFLLFLVVVLLALVTLFGVGFLVGIAVLIRPLMILAMILYALLILFIYPFTSCVQTLLYYDLRVRKEAFDLELLKQQLGPAQTVS